MHVLNQNLLTSFCLTSTFWGSFQDPKKSKTFLAAPYSNINLDHVSMCGTMSQIEPIIYIFH